MNQQTRIYTSDQYRMQTPEGQFIIGTFIIEQRMTGLSINVAKFVTEINGEMIYMNVTMSWNQDRYGVYFDTFKDFGNWLNANEYGEVFNKARLHKSGCITGPTYKLTLI